MVTIEKETVDGVWKRIGAGDRAKSVIRAHKKVVK
jgi:hypothetical protein